MKISCAISLIFIFSSEFSCAQNPFCQTYNKPLKPVKIDGERVSEAKCKEYTWGQSVQEYETKWNSLCNGDSGVLLETEQGDFRHMAALGWGSPSNWKFLCGASLISPNFVLAAAHCTYSFLLDSPSIVRLGATNIHDPSNNVLDIPIKKITKNQNYTPPKTYYDISLIELTEAVRFSQFVQPACLWANDDLGEYQNKVIAAAWINAEELRNNSKGLLVGPVDVIDSDICDNMLYNFRNRNWKNGLQSHQICVETLKGINNTCENHSGGPIQFTTENTIKTTYVFGISNIFIRTNSRCGETNKPEIYTKVASFIDWIEETVWPKEYKDNQLLNSSD